KRNKLRGYFRSYYTSGQRFRPLDHRPEQVLDYAIFYFCRSRRATDFPGISMLLKSALVIVALRWYILL
ncbi:MAG: hypothetical protein PHH77_12790, partial [Victivallaceae bacterium]|nr:hypothetical protein [Victivallaceae bacterium]